MLKLLRRISGSLLQDHQEMAPNNSGEDFLLFDKLLNRRRKLTSLNLDAGLSRKHNRRKHRTSVSSDMQQSTTTAQVHKSPPARVHNTGRRHRSQSRHEKHKCHKHRQRVQEESLQAEVAKLRTENYLLGKRLTASTTSLDSGLPTEGLPPFDVDLKHAYKLVKNDNNQLIEDAKTYQVELERLKIVADNRGQENVNLKQDIYMLKNLVYRLNVELEKFQDIRDKTQDSTSQKKHYELPSYYNKNFLKPILPLLRAYTEVIEEKKETIDELEANFERFSTSFNELLKENETLYKELEIKRSGGDENLFDEVKILRKDVDILREEKEVYCSQVRLEGEKLKEVHALYKTKVGMLEKDKEAMFEKLQDARGELCTLKGKQAVLKQELDRLRTEDESKVPMVVHSASIGECKRLFQDLKNDHESERQMLSHKLKECEAKLRMKEEELRKDNDERLNLEQGNFDLAFENDVIKRRIAELEARGEPMVPEKDRRAKEELQDVKKQLREFKKKYTELEGKLQKTKKQLQQAMAFAEDIVREQEGLLAQLHEKQRENSMMASQFGSLKSKLKIVEKGAQEGLDSVESKMKDQEAENMELVNEVERLSLLLLEKETPERQVETEDSIS